MEQKKWKKEQRNDKKKRKKEWKEAEDFYKIMLCDRESSLNIIIILLSYCY